MRVVSRPPISCRKGRRLHASRPDDELGGDKAAIGELNPIGADLGDTRLGADLDTDLVQQRHDVGGQTLGDCRQNPVRRFDEGDLQILGRIDPVETGGGHVTGRAMKFRRELGSGGAGSDHHHVELPGPHRADLGMGAQHAVDQALVEPHRLLLRVEGDGVLLHPRRAEIVGGRAHREDQRIVGNRADGRDLTPLGIVARGELDRARATVESCHRADTIAEMMAVGVVEIVHRMVADIEAASGDLVQQRLPDMSAGLVHEGDVSLAFPAPACRRAWWPAEAPPRLRRRPRSDAGCPRFRPGTMRSSSLALSGRPYALFVRSGIIGKIFLNGSLRRAGRLYVLSRRTRLAEGMRFRESLLRQAILCDPLHGGIGSCLDAEDAGADPEAHEAQIGVADRVPLRVATGAGLVGEAGLERLQPCLEPVPYETHHVVFRDVVGRHQVVAHTRDVERMGVAGDDLRKGTGACPRPRLLRQQGRFGVDVLEIVEDRQRLGQGEGRRHRRRPVLPPAD